MLRSMLRKVFERELPVVRASSDLMDKRGRRIASENFVRITDIPGLYFKLQETTGHVEVNPSELVGDRPPAVHSQLLAGAILSYELTQRPGFRIPLDNKTINQYGGAGLNKKLEGTFQRKMSIGEYEQLADYYVQIAGQIYEAFEGANRDPQTG